MFANLAAATPEQIDALLAEGESIFRHDVPPEALAALALVPFTDEQRTRMLVLLDRVAAACAEAREALTK